MLFRRHHNRLDRESHEACQPIEFSQREFALPAACALPNARNLLRIRMMPRNGAYFDAEARRGYAYENVGPLHGGGLIQRTERRRAAIPCRRLRFRRKRI